MFCYDFSISALLHLITNKLKLKETKILEVIQCIPNQECEEIR